MRRIIRSKPEFLILAVRPHAFGSHRTGFTTRDNFFESGSYVSLLILGGAILGASLAIARRWREHLFWIAVIIAAYLFAMADATPLHWFASWLLPPLRHFRAPPRALFVAMFALSVLGAAGWRQVEVWLRNLLASPACASSISSSSSFSSSRKATEETTEHEYENEHEDDKGRGAAFYPQGNAGRPFIELAPQLVMCVFVALVFADLRLVFQDDFSAMPVSASALEAPSQWPAIAAGRRRAPCLSPCA